MPGSQLSAASFWDGADFATSAQTGSVTLVGPANTDVEVRIKGFAPVMTHAGGDLSRAVNDARGKRSDFIAGIADSARVFDIGDAPGETEKQITFAESDDVFKISTGLAAGPAVFTPDLLHGLGLALAQLGF